MLATKQSTMLSKSTGRLQYFTRKAISQFAAWLIRDGARGLIRFRCLVSAWNSREKLGPAAEIKQTYKSEWAPFRKKWVEKYETLNAALQEFHRIQMWRFPLCAHLTLFFSCTSFYLCPWCALRNAWLIAHVLCSRSSPEIFCCMAQFAQAAARSIFAQSWVRLSARRHLTQVLFSNWLRDATWWR